MLSNIVLEKLGRAERMKSQGLLKLAKDAVSGQISVANIELRRDPRPFFDVVAHIGDGAFLDQKLRSGIREKLQAMPEFSHAKVSRNSIKLRFSDAIVGEFGQACLAVGIDSRITRPVDNRRMLIRFWDPNATKALHVGHLRNLAIGNALVHLMRTGGACVETQAIICDIGRSVCEAMAGYENSDFTSPASAELKADVFVGNCYSQYVATHDPTLSVLESNDPVAREFAIADDEADVLLSRWQRGDERTRDLWQRLVNWSISGQKQTLARLGVRIDRCLFESDYVEDSLALLQEGLEMGGLTRLPDGAICFETKREEYPRLLLARPDGFPTEHMRLIAHWIGIQALAEQFDEYVVSNGDEWIPTWSYREDVQRMLRPCPLLNKLTKLPYGMVTIAGSKMKSREGESILIDSMLDMVVDVLKDTPSIPSQSNGDHLNRLARIILFGYFLSWPSHKPIEFSIEQLLDEEHNPSWSLLKCWLNLNHPQIDGHSVCEVCADSADRHVVVQHEYFCEVMASAVEEKDYYRVAKSLFGISKWANAQSLGVGAQRILRQTISFGMGAIGIAPE